MLWECGCYWCKIDHIISLSFHRVTILQHGENMGIIEKIENLRTYNISAKDEYSNFEQFEVVKKKDVIDILNEKEDKNDS